MEARVCDLFVFMKQDNGYRWALLESFLLFRVEGEKTSAMELTGYVALEFRMNALDLAFPSRVAPSCTSLCVGEWDDCGGKEK